MKTQTIITSAFVALASLAGTSAFADAGDAYRAEPAFTSQMSRTAVKAELLAAQKAGTLRFAGERDLPVVFMGMADANKVRAEALQFVKHPMLSVDQIGS